MNSRGEEQETRGKRAALRRRGYHYAQYTVDLPVDRISRALARYRARSR